MKYFWIIPFLALAACGGNNEAQKTADASQPLPEKESPNLNQDKGIETPSSDWKTAKFVIKDLGENDMGNPQSIVQVNVGGKNILIDTILACSIIPKNNFDQYQIPSNAIGACGGWWAGGGDYFYAIEKDNRLQIFAGWLDEGQEDNSYHWKKVKELK